MPCACQFCGAPEFYVDGEGYCCEAMQEHDKREIEEDRDEVLLAMAVAHGVVGEHVGEVETSDDHINDDNIGVILCFEGHFYQA